MSRTQRGLRELYAEESGARRLVGVRSSPGSWPARLPEGAVVTMSACSAPAFRFSATCRRA